MTSSATLLSAEGLGRCKATKSWLLHDISFAIGAGDRVAITGPTGSGKTLLLRALALLDPIDAGQLHWRERTIVAADVPRFRSQVIYVHQRPALVEGTVEENLRLPFLLAANRNRKFGRATVLSLLDRMNRGSEFLAAKQQHLSGGERQIVSVVRALQLDPAVLLLDEPTASLDDRATKAMESLILNWHNDRTGERSFAWVTHDRAQAERVANRAVSLSDGSLDEEQRG